MTQGRQAYTRKIVEPENTDSLSDSGVGPSEGNDLRVEQTVSDALESTPGGDKLIRYFGFGQEPEQSEEEASRGRSLLEHLGRVAEKEGDPTGVLGMIAKHANSSEVDPDALRALMRSPKKSRDTED